jgi:hypothetical protein
LVGWLIRCFGDGGTRSRRLILHSFCAELRQWAVSGLLYLRYFVLVCINSASLHPLSQQGSFLRRFVIPQIDCWLSFKASSLSTQWRSKPK